MQRTSVLLALLLFTLGATAQQRESVLIKTSKPYTNLVNTIEKMGGTVTYQYEYVNGIAAEVPAAALPTLEKIVGSENLAKDELMTMPQVDAPLRTDPSIRDGVEADAIAEDGATPSDYVIDNLQTNATSVHSLGYTGTGMVVAVIDSGYRGIITHVPASRVLTGFSLVPGEPDANSASNFPHGTQVAGQIAANRGLCFSNLNRFAVTALAVGAGSISAGCPANTILIPIVGSAPLATIYPVKIFPNSGAGSPTSRTIAAMEHVLSKRLAFNHGQAGGLNIKVVNMSLGGPTRWAGRTLSDETVDKLLAHDIVVVVSAGNEGFSTVTGGSPGTSMSALTVGSSNDAAHERIQRSQFNAPCNTAPLGSVVACAHAWRPDSNLQMSIFSARGPTHDGRVKPDVTANGSSNFAQGSGSNSTVNFINGTSFSSPIVAGIATILRQAVPTATARQIRNAIILSANPATIPTAKNIDQGAGFVNAAAALALLQAGSVPDTVQLDFPGTTRNLQANMAKAGIAVMTDSASVSFSGIRPAQTAEVAYMVPPNAAALNVTIRDIVPANAPADQNQFFGDDVLLQIQRSVVHDDSLAAQEFLKTSKSYVFANPDSGIWRITPTGDWTNRGTVSFVVDVWTTEVSSPGTTAKAKIGQGDTHTYTITVPSGTAALVFDLTWRNMNGSYPINDVDMTIVPPGGPANFSCSTARTPELCSFANPVAGNWTVTVEGFSIIPDGTPGGTENYTLRATADGKVLKTN